jgi:DNA-binding winged helix-turn-helix (wHTH) protein
MDQPATRVVYEVGDFCVDAGQRLLRARSDGEPIPLTSKAFETLLYLVEHAGELVDKTTLMKAVWPNVVVEENNLNQSISAVRRALGESALEHRFIVTVPGRGYRFVAPVRQENPSSEPFAGSTPPISAPPSVPESTTSAASAPAASSSVAWYTRHRVALLMAAAILAVGGAWLALRSQNDVASTEAPRTIDEDPARAPAGAKLRLAVLPFENLSPDSANAFFTDGLKRSIGASGPTNWRASSPLR